MNVEGAGSPSHLLAFACDAEGAMINDRRLYAGALLLAKPYRKADLANRSARLWRPDAIQIVINVKITR